MGMTQILAICCFIISAPQGLSASLQLMDRFGGKTEEGAMDSPRTHRTFSACLLLVSTIFTIGLGFWIWYHPLKPVTIERTITVEKPIPCPATKTGPATARSGPGGTAIGHSGNGDTYTIPSAAKPPK